MLVGGNHTYISMLSTHVELILPNWQLIREPLAIFNSATFIAFAISNPFAIIIVPMHPYFKFLITRDGLGILKSKTTYKPIPFDSPTSFSKYVFHFLPRH